jgi:hypothetical protein
MSVIAKPLAQAGYVPNADTTIYTAPTSTRTIIDKVTLANIDASSHTITTNLVGSGGSVGANNIMTPAVTISAGAVVELTELKNQVLGPNDFLSVKADAANALVIRVSGRECT